MVILAVVIVATPNTAFVALNCATVPTPVTFALVAPNCAIVPKEVMFGWAAVLTVPVKSPLKVVAVRTPVTSAPVEVVLIFFALLW